MSRPTCSWDTGSATGCQPACDRPATRVVEHTGYRGPYRAELCDQHANRVAGRIYPERIISDQPLAS